MEPVQDALVLCSQPRHGGWLQEGFLEEWYLSLILKDVLAKHDIEGIPG